MIITPFKQFFEKEFAKKQVAFKNNPSLLVEWVKKNIRINPDKKALQIAQTPIGVYRARLTDARSRKVFFVDVARSLGIEAQVDEVTKKTQYKNANGGEWIDVDFDNAKQKVAARGKLVMKYADNGAIDDPKYYSHFTLHRINPDGSTSLLEYPEEGCTWSGTFKMGWNWMKATIRLLPVLVLPMVACLQKCRCSMLKRAVQLSLICTYVLLLLRLL